MISSRLYALPHPAKQTTVFFTVMAAFLGKKDHDDENFKRVV